MARQADPSEANQEAWERIIVASSPNGALLPDASTSPLRAQRGAAKRGR